jgi:hypothetical protein
MPTKTEFLSKIEQDISQFGIMARRLKRYRKSFEKKRSELLNFRNHFLEVSPFVQKEIIQNFSKENLHLIFSDISSNEIQNYLNQTVVFDISVRKKTSIQECKMSLRMIKPISDDGFLCLDDDYNKLYYIKVSTKEKIKSQMKILESLQNVCNENLLKYMGHFEYLMDTKIVYGILLDYKEGLVPLDKYLEFISKDNTYLTLEQKKKIELEIEIFLNKLEKSKDVSLMKLNFKNIIIDTNDFGIKVINIDDMIQEQKSISKIERHQTYLDIIQNLKHTLENYLSSNDRKKILITTVPKCLDLSEFVLDIGNDEISTEFLDEMDLLLMERIRKLDE